MHPFRFFRCAMPGLLVLAAACHHAAPNAQIEPVALYQRAMRDFRAGRYQKAQTELQRLQFDLGPRDSLLVRVHFYLAETYAGLGDMITAAREFRRVADDYPSDSLAPFALLRTGDQYGLLWRNPELDPTHGETAVNTYQELLNRYPNSRAAEVAQIRMRSLQNRFAVKDYENGLFYLKRGAYDSAILYFRNLIATYPSATIVPDAYIRLVEAYRAIGYREERDETCAHLQQYFGGREDVRRACGDGSPGR